MNYNDILKSLAVRQGVILSKKHLIRLLKMHGYSRRQYDDLGDEIDFIMQQLKGNGNLHGYRWMYSKCMKHGIRANYNYICHTDSYYKWKPYRICINGYIDGFSR